MLSKQTLSACAIVLILGMGSAGVGRAAPLTFNLASGSSLTVSVASPTWQISAAATQNYTGTITADLTFGNQAGFGQVATQGQLVGAQLLGSNVTTTLDLGFLGGLQISTSSLGATLQGPSAAFLPPPLAAGVTQLSLGGTALNLNAGSLAYQGQGIIAVSVGTQSFDLAAHSLSLALQASDRWKVVLEGGAQPTDSIQLTIPIHASGRLQSDPFILDVSLSGTLVANYMAGCSLPSLVGDANGDNSVGAADYAIWAAQFGQSGSCLPADFDRNGSVGAGDYALWAANFGKTAPQAALSEMAQVSAVPEPSPALLLALGGLLGLLAGSQCRGARPV